MSKVLIYLKSGSVLEVEEPRGAEGVTAQMQYNPDSPYHIYTEPSKSNQQIYIPKQNIDYWIDAPEEKETL